MSQPAETVLIAQRIKWWRLDRKLSQQVVADRAEISRSYLSKIESGASRVDSRSTVERIAGALGVSYAELTGQPAAPDTPELRAAHSGIDLIRTAYVSSNLIDGADVRPRALDLIVSEVDRAAAAWQECDYAAATRDLGHVITELHALTVSGESRDQAAGLLTQALDTAAWTARVLGHYDLAHSLATRESEAAQIAGEPALIGLAAFTRSLMTAASGSGRTSADAAGRRTLERAIASLRPRANSPERLQVLGMLHLAAARLGVHLADDDEVLGEAKALAERTGEGTALRLYFGPTNTAIWQVHLAMERRDGGRAAEIARGVRPELIPSRARRSMYWRHLGLALAQERGKEQVSTKALLRAERSAPGKLRLDPLAREAVGHMLTRARAAAGGSELITLARHVGVL